MGKIWAFLKGKKTIIGAIVSVITRGLAATGKIDLHTAEMIENGAAVVMTIGLGDKAVDAATGGREPGRESEK